jgi:hypothetical protein
MQAGQRVFGTPLRLSIGADWGRILIGIFLIAAVLFGQQLYGMATASSRLDPSLRGAAAPGNVVVVLDFTPERFHNERIAELGVFAGRDRASNRIRLRMVTPENLQRLASISWVARIEPMQ